jgi:hypothetical protein
MGPHWYIILTSSFYYIIDCEDFIFEDQPDKN